MKEIPPSPQQSSRLSVHVMFQALHRFHPEGSQKEKCLKKTQSRPNQRFATRRGWL